MIKLTNRDKITSCEGEKMVIAKTVFEQHYPNRADCERHKKRRCNKTKQIVPAQTVLGPRQHCRLTICIELVELTVSDDKIQITILILRRGALSRGGYPLNRKNPLSSF